MTKNLISFFLIQEDAKSVDVDEPSLPRIRRVNTRITDGFENNLQEQTVFSNTKEYYKKPYLEAFEKVTKGIKKRFNQNGYKTYQNLETLLLKAAVGEDYENELKFVTEFYDSDLNPDELRAQLKLFTNAFPKPKQYEKVILGDIIEFMKSSGMKVLLSEVVIVLKLVLVLPSTNAQSERSFSKLKLVKDYLSNTMKQERLNHLMICNIYKEELDNLSLSEIGNEFVDRNPRRFETFGVFQN